MKKYVLLVIAVGMLLTGIAPVAVAATSGFMDQGVNTARSTTESYVVESPHNYYNNMDQYYYIDKPGATEMRCHFTRIDTERNYDYLYVYDENYNQIYKLHGLYSSGGWTTWITGDRIILRLDTDYSVTKWGFKVDLIDYEGGTADTQAPSVTVTNPANGATVSGTVSVTASASDNVGVTKVEFFVDGSLKSTDTSSPYSYSWDTTAVSNGGHSVMAKAYDAAGNTNSDTNSVTVSNTVSSGDMGLGIDAYDAYGATDSATTLSTPASGTGEIAYSGDQYDQYKVAVSSGDEVTITYSGPGTGLDVPIYQVTKSAIVTKYNTNGFTETVTASGNGYIYITIDADVSADTGTYSLEVTIDSGGGGGGDWGTGGKYAIVIGISDYQSISDLNYCDEDATDWYNQLNGLGYEVHVYGDGHTSNYPRYDGTATEAVIRSAVQDLAAHAQAGDSVVITTSGHGSGNGAGSSYLCMYDCSGSAGCYYDTEFAADIGLFASGVDIFIFIDHCYSGGMGPELMALSNNDYIYCTTTCTEDGYGWDVPSYSNGMWTYYFLDYSWQSHYGGDAGDNMEKVFDYAHDAAVAAGYDGGDEPQEFDGSSSLFYL
jgi:hypothetical protein